MRGWYKVTANAYDHPVPGSLSPMKLNNTIKIGTITLTINSWKEFIIVEYDKAIEVFNEDGNRIRYMDVKETQSK